MRDARIAWGKLPLITLFALTFPRQWALQSAWKLPMTLMSKPGWLRTLQFAAPVSVTAGTMHAVSGASQSQTTRVVPVPPSTDSAEVATGENFTWVFRGSGGHRPKSYSVSNLPEGITYSGEVTAGVASLQGTPTVPGDYRVRIRGYEHSGLRGPSTPVFTLDLNVTAPKGVETFLHWAERAGLEGDAALPLSDPDNDASANLLEYAFHFDPKTPEGLAGGQDGFAPLTTPQIMRRTPASLHVAYLRRRADSGADIRYQLEFSHDLVSWKEAEGTRQMVPLDSTWEMVLTLVPIQPQERLRYFRARIDHKGGD